MSTITLPNIRVSSDLTVKLKLKDGGVALDWSTLTNIKVSIYSDAQRALAGRCSVAIDAEDSTLLVCTYAANKPQYVGVNRVVVSAKYMNETKTYDKPAFNFVRWTDDQEGQTITIDDPDIDVEISVEDVSSSILQEAVDAANTAAERANEAAEAAEHMVDIHTGPAGKSAYEVAVEEGYTGTEEEWLASLKGPVGETPDITIGTVTTAEPGTPASATMTGTPEDPVLNLTIPKGAVGATPNFTVGTVTTGEPGTPVVVTITGTPEAPVLNVTIPQGMQGNTGSSVDYPYELVNNLTTNDATKGLSAAQGKVLKDELSQLEAKVDDLSTGKYYGYFAKEEDLPEADVDGFAYVGEGPTYTIYNLRDGVWTSSEITVNQSPIGNDEDIDQNEDGKLQFANRVYNAQQPNGMGYKILRKDATFASQVTDTNTIYEIRYDFNLNGATITIPKNCVLRFNGGKVTNGQITGQNTRIDAEMVQIFSGITFSGSFDSPFRAEWMLPVYNASTDYTQILTDLFNCGAKQIVFTAPNRYQISDTVVINNDVEIWSDIPYSGNKYGEQPTILATSKITALNYKHTDGTVRITLRGLTIVSGDPSTEADYTTPIVKIDISASGWRGADIELNVINTYDANASYDGTTYEKFEMVGIEVNVISGSFTLSDIKGKIVAHKALYFHVSGSGWITSINIAARIEAAYGGEIEAGAIYLRGQFQTKMFPNDIPAIRPSDCFFYGGTHYVEDSFIYDLNNSIGSNNLISAVRYGTDGSSFSQVTTIPKVRMPNLPTQQSFSMVNFENGDIISSSDLRAITIEASQDDFSTILLTEADVENIDGLFSTETRENNLTYDATIELNLFNAFFKPTSVVSAGVDTASPLQVRMNARYVSEGRHWVRVHNDINLPSLKVTVNRYSDSGYSTRTYHQEFDVAEMTSNASVTKRNAFCYVNTVDGAFEELIIEYSIIQTIPLVFGEKMYCLRGFNTFSVTTDGRKKHHISSPYILNDWMINRMEGANMYYPLDGKQCYHGFYIIAPTQLQRGIVVDFELGIKQPAVANYCSVDWRRGTLILKTDGTAIVLGTGRYAPKVYKSDFAISGLSYYRLSLNNYYVRVNNIYARNIYLELGTDGSTSVGSNQVELSATLYRTIGFSYDRPALGSITYGYQYFDQTLGKTIWWDGTKWIDCDGYKAMSKHGATASRPSPDATDIGFQFFDETLGKVIVLIAIQE